MSHLTVEAGSQLKELKDKLQWAYGDTIVEIVAVIVELREPGHEAPHTAVLKVKRDRGNEPQAKQTPRPNDQRGDK